MEPLNYGNRHGQPGAAELARARARRELSTTEYSELDAAHRYAMERYCYYRKRLDVEDSFHAAIAWSHNSTAQYRRRRSHGTGAV